MFSALRTGATIYILDKSGEPKVKTGYVSNVTTPRPMYQTYNPSVSLGMNMQTVVDLTVKIDDENKEFSGLLSTETIARNSDYVISESKDQIIQEVDMMLQNSRSIINSIDKHEAIITACENILKELNPTYAKEQERDEAIDSLTEQVNGMQSTLSRLEELLTKLDNGNKQIL